MSTQFLFNPELAEYIEEAFERCGIDPAELKGRHIRSAIRSTNLMLADWQTFGYKQFTLNFASLPLPVGERTIQLPVGAYDIYHATLKSDGTETEMYSISRSDYNALHDKSLRGRPDRYYVDRSTFVGANPASTVFLWQTPDRASYTMEVYYMQAHEGVSGMRSVPRLSPAFFEAFASGLAFHLSRKFAPDRRGMFELDYLGRDYDPRRHTIPGGALGRALSEDRDRAPAVFRVEFGPRGRR